MLHNVQKYLNFTFTEKLISSQKVVTRMYTFRVVYFTSNQAYNYRFSTANSKIFKKKNHVFMLRIDDMRPKWYINARNCIVEHIPINALHAIHFWKTYIMLVHSIILWLFCNAMHMSICVNSDVWHLRAEKKENKTQKQQRAFSQG